MSDITNISNPLISSSYSIQIHNLASKPSLRQKKCVWVCFFLPNDYFSVPLFTCYFFFFFKKIYNKKNDDLTLTHKKNAHIPWFPLCVYWCVNPTVFNVLMKQRKKIAKDLITWMIEWYKSAIYIIYLFIKWYYILYIYFIHNQNYHIQINNL